MDIRRAEERQHTRRQQRATRSQPYRHRRAHHALCRESVAETFRGGGAQQLSKTNGLEGAGKRGAERDKRHTCSVLKALPGMHFGEKEEKGSGE